MDTTYEPPFIITEDMLNLAIEISELAKLVSVTQILSVNTALQKENRIHSIYASLRGNTDSLSLEQVRHAINGNQVPGRPRELREIENACDAYNQLNSLNPYLISDLLKEHYLLLADMTSDAGQFRKKWIGLYAGDKIVYEGTPVEDIPEAVKQLLHWTSESTLHMLIKASIFYYRFDRIHPFSAGNRRIGLMWYILLLSQWETLFLWLPLERLIYERQDYFYRVLHGAAQRKEATPVVVFMMTILRDALKEIYPAGDKAISSKNCVLQNNNILFDSNKVLLHAVLEPIDEDNVLFDKIRQKILPCKLNRRTKTNILILYQSLEENIPFGRTEVVRIFGCSDTAAGNLINKMKRIGLLQPIRGQGKGKYLFNPENLQS